MVTGAQIADAAKSLAGIRWASGGRSAGGVDCSGLCILAAKRAGLDLPSYQGQYDPKFPDPDLMMRALEGIGEMVSRKDALPGMLVLMKVRGLRGATHLGVCLPDGMVCHMEPVKRRAVIRSMDDLKGAIVACVKLNGVEY